MFKTFFFIMQSNLYNLFGIENFNVIQDEYYYVFRTLNIDKEDLNEFTKNGYFRHNRKKVNERGFYVDGIHNFKIKTDI